MRVSILIMNDAEVRRLCEKHNMMDLYKEWRANAPIEEFVKKTVPDQVKRGD